VSSATTPDEQQPARSVRYRLGPKPLDVAVLLPEGAGWIHLRNSTRLRDADVEDWLPLSLSTQVHTDEDYDELLLLKRFAEERIALIAEVLSVTDVVGVPKKGVPLGQHVAMQMAAARHGHVTTPDYTPDQIRVRMMREWARGPLTVRQAAQQAKVDGAPNYTTRFATDLLRWGYIEASNVKVGHARVNRITDYGRKWLLKNTEPQLAER
jgi:hypothetical protein